MATQAKVPNGGRRRALALGLLGVAGLAWIGPTLRGAPAEKAGPTTAVEARDLQTRYKAERAALQEGGKVRKFSAKAVEQADALAKKGEAALTAGRLLEARETFRQARWVLPYA